MNWQNQFGTKSLEDFNRVFFKNNYDKASWAFFDEVVIIQMDDQRHAEIHLSDGKDSSGTYTYYRVKIVNKKTGPITSHDFDFSLLDGPKNDAVLKFKVIEHCGKDWYMNGPDPKSVTKLANKIMDWIETVR